WHSAHFDFPCTPSSERHHDKAGRVYVRVTTPDGSSIVPEDELEPVTQPTQPQPQQPQAPPTQPQTPPAQPQSPPQAKAPQPQTPPPQTPRPQTSTPKPQTATPKPRRFAVKTLEKITMPSLANYVVKGILPRVGLGVVWGPPKCGKSFLTY